MFARIKQMWLLILVVLVGEGIVVSVLWDVFATADETESGAVAEATSLERRTDPMVMYGKPVQVVANPRGTGGLRIVIVEFDLYLDDPMTIEIVDQHLGQVSDAVIKLLGEKTVDAYEQRGCVKALKGEIARAVDEVLPWGRCYDSCIRMLVLQ